MAASKLIEGIVIGLIAGAVIGWAFVRFEDGRAIAAILAITLLLAAGGLGLSPLQVQGQSTGHDVVNSVFSEAIWARLGSSIGWGIALFFLLPIAAVLLLVTVVGIPLGLFVLFALALIYTIGYTVATHGMGRLVMRTSSRYVAFLVGVVILRALALIPVVGGLLWLLATAWGLGLLAVAIRAGHASRTIAAAPPPPIPATG